MYELSSGPRVLLVEDDEIVREIVMAHLAHEGAQTTPATNLETGLAEYMKKRFDLVIADVNLPDGLGFDLIQGLRRHRDCAVIYMTSRSDPLDLVLGLETGDDYIVKPFELTELSARMKAVLRRYRKMQAPTPPLIMLSNWTLDLVRRELANGEGLLVPLTRGEFDLFAALVQASPMPLSRDYLLEVVASADATTSIRTIDVMISRIRTKLEDSPSLRIATVRSSGYRFSGPVS